MKKFHIIYLLSIAVLLGACGGESDTDLTPTVEAETVQGEFFANLFENCGETFSGQVSEMQETQNDISGETLIATFQTCTEEEVQIALAENGNALRTWIVSRSDDGLQLNLRNANAGDPTMEATGFGGMANDEGSANSQVFEASDSTAEAMGDTDAGVWTLGIEDGQFSYALEQGGETTISGTLSKD
jgi:hypothetical protein